MLMMIQLVSASVGEVFAGLEHGLELVIPAQLLADDGVPEAVLVVVEVHWQVRSALLPHLVNLGWLWETQVLVLVRSLSLQLLAADLL